MDPAPPKPVLVKVDMAARLLDCGRTKVYELVRTGALETVRIGKDQRITYASIERLAAPKA